MFPSWTFVPIVVKHFEIVPNYKDLARGIIFGNLRPGATDASTAVSIPLLMYLRHSESILTGWARS